MGLRGAKDEEIIEYALKTNRIIVTEMLVLEAPLGTQNIQEQ